MSSHTFVRLTDHSLSRARPPRASLPDARELAKREGLQARASVRPRVGCSEKLGRAERGSASRLVESLCPSALKFRTRWLRLRNKHDYFRREAWRCVNLR